MVLQEEPGFTGLPVVFRAKLLLPALVTTTLMITYE
jgi:hypothetical protein